MTQEVSQAPAWATVWATAMQGPYPAGNATGQPDMSFVFPDPLRGACDQSFRMVLRPSVWGRHARLRFSNALGTRPVCLRNVHIGLHEGGGAIVRGTNTAVLFGGDPITTIQPGGERWSDGVDLDFIVDPGDRLLAGRKLAVSFHVEGESGPMTWHAKALQASYIGAPGVAAHAHEEGERGFPFPTTSWYFLDALDIAFDDPPPVVVCFGDSISDGSGSTISGDDRWPDVMSRRLASAGIRACVVNQGIGANEVLQPLRYDVHQPTNGGPSALDRLQRDVLSLSGVTTVIWLEGINDLGRGQARSEALFAGVREGISRIRTGLPGVRIVAGLLTSALGSTIETHGSRDVDSRRRAYNDLLRTSGVADAVIDFDAATRDSDTGGLSPVMKPGSSVGGPGDGLHPNRIGYQAMGHWIDLTDVVAPVPVGDAGQPIGNAASGWTR